MSRGLNATIVGYLESGSAIYEYLVELGSYRWTTGASDVTVTTPTATSANFLSTNGISVITEVTETVFLNETNLGLELKTFSSLTINHNDSLNVYIMFRDPSTFVADTTNLITLYQGVVSDIQYMASDTENIITVQSRSKIFENNSRISITNIDLEPNYNMEVFWGVR